MNSLAAGFLVVVVPDPKTESRSHKYEGVNRVPGYPGDSAEETNVLDFYVFGPCKDPDTNLIPSLEVARNLQIRLSRTSRKYEILLCCEGPNSEWFAKISPDYVEHLGFDVAAIQADYWSIVDDFSASLWAVRFRKKLNEHGLFGEEREAEQYLREYKHRNEPDSDSPLEVVYAARLRTVD